MTLAEPCVHPVGEAAGCRLQATPPSSSWSSGPCRDQWARLWPRAQGNLVLGTRKNDRDTDTQTLCTGHWEHYCMRAKTFRREQSGKERQNNTASLMESVISSLGQSSKEDVIFFMRMKTERSTCCASRGRHIILTAPWHGRQSLGLRCPFYSGPSSASLGPGWASVLPQLGLSHT